MAKKLKIDHLMEKINKLIDVNDKNLLESVILKGNGPHFYYSVADKTMVRVPAVSEMYILPFKRDNNGNLYIFSPWIGGSGIVLSIPEENLTKIGLN